MHLDIPDEKRKKRKRRTAQEIKREHVCPIKDCEKSYGSEGSLNMHLKRKHTDYFIKRQLTQLGGDKLSEIPDSD